MIITASGTTGSIGRHLRNVKSLRARLTDDLKNFESEFKHFSSDTYIHLAALTDIGEADEMKELSYAVNVFGAIKMMEAFANSGGKRFILASTGHVYGLTKLGRISLETDIPFPISVYAMHKLFAERQLSDMSRKYGIELIIARIFSVFGPNMAKHYLASKVYGSAELPLESGEFPMIKNGLDVRDFLSPSEVAETLNRLAISKSLTKQVEIINICSGQGQSLGEKIMKVVPRWPQNRIEKSNSNIPFLVGSVTKLRSILEG